jgi:hypothetical protein
MIGKLFGSNTQVRFPAIMNPDLQSTLDGELELVTDVVQMDLKTIHAYLSRSYWAAGIPLEIVQKSLEP